MKFCSCRNCRRCFIYGNYNVPYSKLVADLTIAGLALFTVELRGIFIYITIKLKWVESL